MDEFKVFHDITANPRGYASKWKEMSKGLVIGYLCSYSPEELIHAAGALPFRILGYQDNDHLSDSHLQAYCCSFARAAMGDALGGKLSFLDGTVFPHTCDTIQRLSDIWRLNAGFPIHIDVILPVKLNSESARAYCIEVFKKFKRDLEKKMGIEITEEKLKETAILYNALREKIMEIYSLQRQVPGIISGKDLYTLLNAAALMDRRDLLSHLETVVKALAAKHSAIPDANKKRVLLSGGICGHPDIYSVIEASGGVVVGDDLCTGSRSFDGSIDMDNDVVAAIARRYMDRMNCPSKHSGLSNRGRDLLDIARRNGAHGVIFLFLKFCDPHGFDYPYLKSYLDDEGIPSLLLEVEKHDLFDGQLKTKIESFIEIL